MPDAVTIERYAASPAVDPGLALLLDHARLSDLVGVPVRVTSLRPKPGVSHTAALVSEPEGRVLGWVQALLGPAQAKLPKTRRRADEAGLGPDLREAALPGGSGTVAWGPVATDPRLAVALADLVPGGSIPPAYPLPGPPHGSLAHPVPANGRGRAPRAPGAEVLARSRLLRYNPLRRLVLRHGDHVVRVTASPHRDLAHTVGPALGARGVPVLVPEPEERAGLHGGRRVSVWRWVEGHDLAAHGSRDELRAAGAALAALHRVPAGVLPGLPRRGWAEQRTAAEQAVEQLAVLAPGLASDALAALAALPPQVAASAPVVLHGDFSLDQCFAADTGQLVLGDLDRVCVGPPEVDLAGVEALASLTGRGVGALLEGYGTDRRPDRSWVAAAVLARALEPWRSQDLGWQEETARRARLARELLAERPGSGRSAP